MHLVVAILKNGRHFEFWNFFRWLTGFIKRAISKEYVCQFWCLFPEMKDSFTYLPHYATSLCLSNKQLVYLSSPIGELLDLTLKIFVRVRVLVRVRVHVHVSFGFSE